MSAEHFSAAVTALAPSSNETNVANPAVQRMMDLVNGDVQGVADVRNSQPVSRTEFSANSRIAPTSDGVVSDAVGQGSRVVASDGASGGFFQKISNFLLSSTGKVSGGDATVSGGNPASAKSGAEKLDQAMERFEESQRFATGTALLSSLTQSVLSSSKRLTQGQ
ncbi:hypothetical protein ACQ3G6_09645 [Allorhizobium undicola]|uniref:hypothetical protein n=1 Tax=Allorhizobium undicola TaxID=78527 RepID=UPI000480B543|nr:hypothetical protein [Allorhizobium undicola]